METCGLSVMISNGTTSVMNRSAFPYLAVVFYDFELDALEDGEGFDFGEPEGLMLGSKLDEEIHFEV